jgi:transposase InsO family protein
MQTLIEEAVANGARCAPACAMLGVSVRTLERWRAGAAEDGRHGPRQRPANALTPPERATLLATVNSPRFCDLSPHQIVPRLADAGQYLASESTMYRVLREEQQLTHRGRTAVPQRRAAPSHEASGPNQVWSWDITYLKSPVRGVFCYLSLILDIWSRKIVGWTVETTEGSAHAAALFQATCAAATHDPTGIVLHADNGGPMKGATMLATLERLGVVASFSRPGVSNDNPFSEALFRTAKYRPDFPREPFTDVASAAAWVAAFVQWYNHEHQHSAIRFVTPAQRHDGLDDAILAQRATVYADAKARQPARWSGATRDWTPVTTVRLNPTYAVAAGEHRQ